MTEPDFTGGVALVTGAASGIGRAIVAGLCARGVQVSASDVDGEGLSSLAREHAGRVHTEQLDVTDARAVQRWVAHAERELGEVSWLAHAAGVMVQGKLCEGELDAERFRRALSINTEGVWAVARAAAQPMMQRRRGAIAVVSSNAARTPRMGMGAYCASKAASTMLTLCLGLELAGHGIRCNVVSPGSTDTPMLEAMRKGRDYDGLVQGDARSFRTGIPLGRVASASDVADAVLFLLSARARHVTMHDLRVDGGATW